MRSASAPAPGAAGQGVLLDVVVADVGGDEGLGRRRERQRQQSADAEVKFAQAGAYYRKIKARLSKRRRVILGGGQPASPIRRPIGPPLPR